MDVHGSLKMQSSGVQFFVETNFPENPTAGRVCFKDKKAYLCVENAGLPVWIPMTQEITMQYFSVTTPALEWTLNHTLDTTMPLIQVYDTDGKWIIPDIAQASSSSSVLIAFGTPMAGTCVIQRGQLVGAVPDTIAFTQTFTSSTTWVVNHNLGRNPAIRCYVSNAEVQPVSVVHNSTLQATVTFSTAQAGFVRCI